MVQRPMNDIRVAQNTYNTKVCTVYGIFSQGYVYCRLIIMYCIYSTTVVQVPKQFKFLIIHTYTHDE